MMATDHSMQKESARKDGNKRAQHTVRARRGKHSMWKHRQSSNRALVQDTDWWHARTQEGGKRAAELSTSWEGSRGWQGPRASTA